MAVVVTQPDREAFRRCRRQWDLQARMRRDLEPVTGRAGAGPAGRPARRARRLLLPRHVGLGPRHHDPAGAPGLRPGARPATGTGCHRSAASRLAAGTAAAGHDLLGRYVGWAPGVDTLLPRAHRRRLRRAGHSTRPGPAPGSPAPDGQPVRFRGRIDLLAVDQHDAYWLVRHRVVPGDWPAAGRAGRRRAGAGGRVGVGAVLSGPGHRRDDLQRVAPRRRRHSAGRTSPVRAGIAQHGRFGRQFRPRIFRLERFRRAQKRDRSEPAAGAPARAERRRPLDPAAPQAVRGRPRAAVASEIEQVTTGDVPPHLGAAQPGGDRRRRPRLAADTAAMLAAGGARHRRTRATPTAGRARSWRRAWPCARAGTARSCSAPGSGPGRRTC